MLTDAEIDALSHAERRQLILRLSRPPEQILPPRARIYRWIRFGAAAAAAIGLIPWLVYLTQTLPHTYRVSHWALTWIGLDLAELILLVVSLVCAVQRRVVVILFAFATGVLVLCDGWFDVMTSTGDDRRNALIAAFVVEIPLALLLITGAFSILRTMAARFWMLEPGQSLWRLRLPRLDPKPEGSRP